LVGVLEAEGRFRRLNGYEDASSGSFLAAHLEENDYAPSRPTLDALNEVRVINRCFHPNFSAARDNGGTKGFGAVAFLDEDHRVQPDRIASLVRLAP
jgi:hypothetical protein